ncbi:MAG: HAD family hydrolase [Lachnospiraceae bacterium]|nr:HAD family hydrolase [Lachnospiraceae bacterium]
MIRLVASDMDGTILRNGAQTLPPRMLPLIQKLHEKNILFVAASGRQYNGLRKLLGPVAHQCDYICENGAMAVHNDKIIYKALFDHDMGNALMEDIWKHKDCEIQLSAPEAVYIQAKDPSFAWHVKNVLHNKTIETDNIFHTGAEYIKISAYVHGDHTMDCLEMFKQKWNEHFLVVSTCEHWIDFVPPHIHKGSALKALLECVGISSKEVMSFGDNYNDIELLSMSGISCAVSDAVPELIQIADHTCSSVEDTLEQFLSRLSDSEPF